MRSSKLPKNPLILGNKGNMGRRYSAILNFLGLPFIGIDKAEQLPSNSTFDSVIICTPTENHINDVKYFMGMEKEILCEKPMGTKLISVLDICERAKDYPLRMVNQYAQLAKESVGPTVYDYFNHGRDSIAWDCINIIGLAKHSVFLGEESPIWRCMINGNMLLLSDIDSAYISMIESWFSGDTCNVPYIAAAHRKVVEFLACKD